MMNQHLLERIKEAAQKTYRIIAPDLFRVTESKALSQVEVIEYVGMYLDYGNDPVAVEAFNYMPDEDKQALLLEVFPEKEYRWHPSNNLNPE